MSRSKHYSLVVLLGSVLFVAGSAAAVQHQRYTDEQIRGIIAHDLSEKDIYGLTVEVQDAVVTLRGQVKSAWERDTAIELASDVHDVQDVRSELTVMKGESDESLARRLGGTIDYNIFYTVFDAVDGNVEDGVVTLTGWVTMGYKADEIVKAVSKVPGVQDVKNEIQVLPASPNDDALRVRLARAIYAEVPELAIRRVPAIRIIVNHGRVILAGAVRNKVERLRAEHAVRGMFGVLSVDNQLRIEGT